MFQFDYILCSLYHKSSNPGESLEMQLNQVLDARFAALCTRAVSEAAPIDKNWILFRLLFLPFLYKNICMFICHIQLLNKKSIS